MSTSTQSARASFEGTSKGKALRGSPATSSTAGVSASGHGPGPPGPPDGWVTTRKSCRYRVRWLLPMRAGPSSASSRAVTPVAPLSPPCTTTWKPRASLRAPSSSTGAAARGGVSGRTFTMRLSPYTWGLASTDRPTSATPSASASGSDRHRVLKPCSHPEVARRRWGQVVPGPTCPPGQRHLAVDTKTHAAAVRRPQCMGAGPVGWSGGPARLIQGAESDFAARASACGALPADAGSCSTAHMPLHSRGGRRPE